MMTELGTIMQTAVHYPLFKNLLLKMIPKRYLEIFAQHKAFAHEKVSKRIQLGKTRHDLIEGLLMKQDELVSFETNLEGVESPL